MGISTISLHSINHDLDLILFEEELGLVGVLREVDEKYESHDCNDGCKNALPDELLSVSANNMFGRPVHSRSSAILVVLPCHPSVVNRMPGEKRPRQCLTQTHEVFYDLSILTRRPPNPPTLLPTK